MDADIRTRQMSNTKTDRLKQKMGGGGNEIEVQTSRGVAGNHKGRNPGRK